MSFIARLIAAAAMTVAWIAAAPDAALTQTQGDQSASVTLGARRGFSAGRQPQSTGEGEDRLQYSWAAGMASDYIYRGVTNSGHNPAVGTAFEARFGSFYAGSTLVSVQLPSNAAAELTLTSGIRPSFSGFDFDFSGSYFVYPGEVSRSNSDYFELVARVDRKLTERLRVAAGFAWSPNVSNTGAWSKYAATGAAIDLPAAGIIPGVSSTFTAGVGYFWFGDQGPALGGFPLPAYTTWNAGVTSTRNRFHLDLRYYDTNLSRENCFVFTGDPNARPGGRADPVTNPEGLISGWCSATAVAKFWFTLD